MTRDFERAVAPVVDVFEEIGVEYYLAGSVISSLFGIARATADVDVVAQLRFEHVQTFVSRLVDAYYVDEDAVADAIRRASMFNVIHLETMLKVDVYIASTSFDRSALSRRQRDSLVVEDPLASLRSRAPRMSSCTSFAGSAMAERCPIGSGATSWASCACRATAWILIISGAGRRFSVWPICSSAPCATRETHDRARSRWQRWYRPAHAESRGSRFGSGR